MNVVANAAGKRVVNKMVELFNLKFTKLVRNQQDRVATTLVKTYCEEDVIDVLKYLALHPPKKGLTSIGFLQYVYNDILPIIIVERLKTIPIKDIQPTIQVDSNNINKFNNIKKQSMKGIGEF